jgi:hypothetical protein
VLRRLNEEGNRHTQQGGGGMNNCVRKKKTRRAKTKSLMIVSEVGSTGQRRSAPSERPLHFVQSKGEA